MSERPEIGEQIAFHRRRLGMSQVEFAAHVGRSESWVSQIERGVRPIDRLSVLQKVADALGVSVTELRGPSEPEVSGGEERPEAYEQLRLVLTGHPAISMLLGEDVPGVDDQRMEELRRLHASAWPLVHEARYDELTALLAELIPTMERATRTAASEEMQGDARRLLADTYQMAAAMLAKTSETDAAWVAADRAAFVAEQVEDPLLVAAGMFRMAHVFVSLRHLSQARHVGESATCALESIASGKNADPRALSIYGAFQLVLAVIAARENERGEARERLAKAREVAGWVGEDRDDFGTEFGPTNVALHDVSIAVELGDAGTALELAADVDTSTLSPERQARFLIDLARAQAMRRQIGEAYRSLEQAERLAPEQTRGLKTAREVARELVQLAGTRARPELRDLAERLDALP